MATRLDILDRLLIGHTVYHRMHDAWDVLDSTGAVVAVLCPRTNHVSISPTQRSRQRAPEGRLIPYGERVALKVTDANLDEGVALLAQLRDATRE